jgi:GNAT superfamily N-acetyltransferase
MAYTIIFEEQPDLKDTALLWKGISEYANQQRGLKPGRSFGFFIKDDAQRIVGGCSGFMFYGCLMIDLLWITEDLRQQGWGRKLLIETENLAKQNNCSFMTVNTMDWEALGFYTKFGFYIEFERLGFDKESIFYLLRKDL